MPTTWVKGREPADFGLSYTHRLTKKLDALARRIKAEKEARAIAFADQMMAEGTCR